MSHCQRVLDLLSDGEPHTHHELYGLNVIAHSRVADLRKRGYQIACWTARDQGERVSVYQLLPALEAAEPRANNLSPGMTGSDPTTAEGHGSSAASSAGALNEGDGTSGTGRRPRQLPSPSLTLWIDRDFGDEAA